MNSVKKDEKILIIGFGRLGGVIARYLDQDYSVFVLDIDKSKLRLAKSKGYGIITPEDVGRFETIYLTVPINTLEHVLEAIADMLSEKTLVIDTCSVKLYPVKLMNEKLKNCHILATHPLFGPDSVNGDLGGLPMVMCPVRVNKYELRKWSGFWAKKGAKIIISTPDKHDKSIAYSLGLTHFIGRILGELDLKKLDMTSRGYDSLLEIIQNTNNDTRELFNDIQRYNPYTIYMRDKIYAAIRKVENNLDKTIHEKMVR